MAFIVGKETSLTDVMARWGSKGHKGMIVLDRLDMQVVNESQDNPMLLAAKL